MLGSRHLKGFTTINIISPLQIAIGSSSEIFIAEDYDILFAQLASDSKYAIYQLAGYQGTLYLWELN